MTPLHCSLEDNLQTAFAACHFFDDLKSSKIVKICDVLILGQKAYCALAVKGQLNVLHKEKTISFESGDKKNPGKVRIKGRDNNRNNNCYLGGLLLHCKASDTTSPWNNFKSGVDHWLDENGDVPCQNDKAFPNYNFPFIVTLNNLGAKKIWAPRQNVILTGSPPR